MRVAIYTSSETSAFNNYNIAELIHNFPNYEFLFVSVKRSNKVVVDSIKNEAFEFIYGKNKFKFDSSIIHESIKRLTKEFDKGKFTFFEVDAVNDLESERILKQFKPDIILQAGAGILKSNIYSISTLGTLNVHHGFSSEIRGMNSTFWCLYYGLHDKIGVTCHFIDKGIDTGAVLYQYKYPYNEYATFIEIQMQLCIEGAILLNKSVELLSKKVKLNFNSYSVKSYYFGKIDYRYYNELKQNNFKRVKKLDESLAKSDFVKMIYSK